MCEMRYVQRHLNSDFDIVEAAAHSSVQNELLQQDHIWISFFFFFFSSSGHYILVINAPNLFSHPILIDIIFDTAKGNHSRLD